MCDLYILFRFRIKNFLSFFYLKGAFPTFEQRLIWKAKNIEVSRWRKVVVDLPNDIDEYRLLFEGECEDGRSYLRNYVTVDNLELRSCRSNKGLLFFLF